MENQNGNIHYYCRGKVVEVYKSQNFASHILVDTRTLGTIGYKRRIMVGDNLKGKTLYGNFLSNLQDYIYIDPDLPGITRSDIKFTSSSRAMEIIDWGFENNYFVDSTQINFEEGGNNILWSNGESYLPKTFSKDKDYIVESISDNPIYRCLLVEDPKIRPIQVGDKITENTKFYFNFPDDLYIKLTNYKVDWIIKIENENGDILGIAASTDEENRTIAARRKKHNVSGVYIGTSFYSHYTPFGTTDGELEMNLSHGIAKNILIDRLEPTLYLLGTVSEINTTYADVYKYILVDITTLG